ncbi:MAG TPA: terminase TerL endonuclease subunit [Candidatus Limnocylindrales bacterium]|nr:terminase TerL endonuclease subunit [Candidatus Limnocylindrales bacterium]
MAIAAPPADAVSAYADAVVSGQIVAGPWVRLAAQRHLRDLEDGHKRGLVWDQEAADYAIAFFSYLRLPEGDIGDDGTVDGDPFVLFPAQKFIVGSLDGWRMADGTRRYRTAYVEMGKGNGKTPLAAGIGLKGIVADKEPAAEVYTAGVTRDQASYLFQDARRMAIASPELQSRLQIDAHNLSAPKTNSFMRPVSSEGRSLDQKRVYEALIDEIMEHVNGDVVRKMRAGTKGRLNALIFEITNSGYDRHSICWQHHDYSIKVLQGIIDNDSWFAYVCALDEGDDYRDEAVWPKVNPGLGITIPIRYLREQVAEAEGMPANEDLVKRLNFCIWTERSAGAFDMARWDACAEPPVMVKAQRVWMGLDLASTTDIAALAIIAPRPGTMLVEVEPGLIEEQAATLLDVEMRFWVPGASARQRAARDHVPYLDWIKDGEMTATVGNVVDQDFIKAAVLQLTSYYDVAEIGFDPWNSTKLVTELMNEGAPMVQVRQGFGSMNSPFKELVSLVASGRLRHGGQPVLRWMASNTVADTDPAGNLKPSKERSTERIDGITALSIAIARWIDVQAEEDDGPSAWELPVRDGGIRSLVI